MRIDLTQRYVNADDTPAIDAKTQEPITLKEILIQTCLSEIASMTDPRAPQMVPGEEKPKRYELYVRLKKAGKFIDLPAEDIALLKRAILIQPVLTVGQTQDMLEGKKQKTNEPKAEPSANATDFDS